MPKLFLVFHLSFAFGCLPSLFFMVLHISTYSMWSLGVLFSIIYLRFFIRALVGDDIFGFFCFLVFFATLIAFVGSFQSCSYLDCPCHRVLLVPLTCFSVRVETCSSSFQSFECQLVFVYTCLEASSFLLWCLV